MQQTQCRWFPTENCLQVGPNAVYTGQLVRCIGSNTNVIATFGHRHRTKLLDSQITSRCSAHEENTTYSTGTYIGCQLVGTKRRYVVLMQNVQFKTGLHWPRPMLRPIQLLHIGPHSCYTWSFSSVVLQSFQRTLHNMSMYSPSTDSKAYSSKRYVFQCIVHQRIN